MTRDLARHKNGPAKSCEEKQTRNQIRKEQETWTKLGWAPAHPHVILLRNLGITMYEVPSRLEKEYTDGQLLRFVVTKALWAPRWSVAAARLPVPLARRRALLQRLSADIDALNQWRSEQQQDALSAARRLGGVEGVRDLVMEFLRR